MTSGNIEIKTVLNDTTRENSRQSVEMATWLPCSISDQMWVETDELKNNHLDFE